jgi:hypothetical protein
MFGHFRIRGQEIRTVKYADDIVLLAEEKTELQEMTDRQTDIGIRYEMQITSENKCTLQHKTGNVRKT